MPRILIAECKQEVSTFNPHLSGYEDFGIRRGDGADRLPPHRAERNRRCVDASLMRRPDVEIGSGVQRVLYYLRRHAGQRRHGSASRRSSSTASVRPRRWMACISACTGRWPVRRNLIPKAGCWQRRAGFWAKTFPIVVSLDLHGILTDRMVEHSDAIVAYHTYPHVDFFETGERAARLLLRIVAGEVKPVTAKVAIPALVRGDELITATGRFGQSIRLAQAAESGPRGLSAGMFIGNPFTDVPALQTYSFVVTDNDPRTCRSAKRCCIAAKFWENHAVMQVPLVSLDEMARLAQAHTKRHNRAGGCSRRDKFRRIGRQ